MSDKNQKHVPGFQNEDGGGTRGNGVAKGGFAPFCIALGKIFALQHIKKFLVLEPLGIIALSCEGQPGESRCEL